MRSVHLQKDKTVFKLTELPAELFAESLGLPGVPRIKFLNKEVAKAKKNAPRTIPVNDISEGSNEPDAETENEREDNYDGDHAYSDGEADVKENGASLVHTASSTVCGQGYK